MEFGKLENAEALDNVNWQIPEDDQTSTDFLSSLPASEFAIAIGAPAWGCKDWVGRLYPEKTKPADFLRRYAENFDAIELNTTHYRIPSPEQIARWKSAVGKEFLFCPKIFKGISHDRKGLVDRQLIHQWLKSTEAFTENGGPSFLQLPPHFDYSQKAELFSFLREWSDSLRLAIEFRHPSWFTDRQILPALADYLRHRRIGLVVNDVAGRRDVLHTSISAEFAMIRFIGNSLHPSDSIRADAWAERFTKWKQNGLEKVYLFVHEPDDITTPEMTRVFHRSLGQRGLYSVPETFGSQASSCASQLQLLG